MTNRREPLASPYEAVGSTEMRGAQRQEAGGGSPLRGCTAGRTRGAGTAPRAPGASDPPRPPETLRGPAGPAHNSLSRLEMTRLRVVGSAEASIHFRGGSCHPLGCRPSHGGKKTLPSDFYFTDISEIQSLASDHSNRSHDRSRRSRSRSPDQRSEPSDHSRHSPQQPSNGR